MEAKKQRKYLVVIAILTVLAVVLSACRSGTDNADKPDKEALKSLGKIQVIAREDGSGTRAVFAQMTGLEQKDSTENAGDMMRTDAEIQDSGEAVLEAVENYPSAIGYVSMGLLGDTTEVKALSVDGVAPETEQIKKENYPLSRTFYLAYSGELSELEQDFLSYVNGAGQKIVSENFVSVKKKPADSFLSGKQSGSIKISGSTSVAPLLQQLADEYEKYNPNARIEIEENDSTQGLTAAMEGTCDLAMSSRDLKSYEAELLEPVEIAKDGILILVGEKNPLQNITMDQLAKIYRGDISQWSDLAQ